MTKRHGVVSALLWSFVQGPSNLPDEIPLKLHFRLKPATISLEGHDGAVPTIGIENHGTEPIYIYKLSCSETWKWSVEDASGVLRDMRMAGADAPTVQTYEDLQLLPAGTAAMGTVGGLIRGSVFAERPGRYRLHVSCTSPVDWSEHEGISVWSRDDGPLATVFEFEILPGRSAYEDLEALEREVARAWPDADRTLLDTLLTDDWVLVDGDGETHTKRAVYSDRFGPDALVIEHITVDEVGVRVFDDVAIVSGLARWFLGNGAVPGEGISMLIRFTDVAVRRDGRWRISWSHETRVVE